LLKFYDASEGAYNVAIMCQCSRNVARGAWIVAKLWQLPNV